MENEILLHIENGTIITEYTHDFEYYDSLSDTYDFSHVMASNTPVSL